MKLIFGGGGGGVERLSHFFFLFLLFFWAVDAEASLAALHPSVDS